MKKVFIIHGFEGVPNGGWRPWLMSELNKKDIYCSALSMPSPEKPNCTEWIEEISRHVLRNKRDEISLVGHSLGVPAILRFLETYSGKKKISKVILVSGPLEKTDIKSVNKFLDKPFNFKKIKSKAKSFFVIHGSDDKIVPISNAVKISELLDAKLKIIKNGGHLNGSSGWYKLPECLNSLIEN